MEWPPRPARPFLRFRLAERQQAKSLAVATASDWEVFCKHVIEVLAHPQVIARKMVREMESPVGPVPVIGSPLRLSDSPARFDPIPSLGEDTEPILRELGYGDADIENLRRDKVI